MVDILNKGSVKELRIVSLGKTGAGKSHTGNIILCDPNAFQTKCSSASETQRCKSATATVSGRIIKYIDTPGFFDTHIPDSQEQLNSEIIRSIVKCAPGPHAFLILFKVERYSGQENEIMRKITEMFGEDALKYAVVLFTHGDDLDDGLTIKDFVEKNPQLQELVNKCGGRCHVIDNKYWNQQEDGYRSNSVQIDRLLNTIDEMSEVRYERYYTNEMLQEAERKINNTMQVISAKSNGKLSKEQIREEAEKRVHTKLIVRLAGVTTGLLLGALLGIKHCVPAVLKMMCGKIGLMEGVGLACCAAVGAVAGAIQGYDAVEGEQTVTGGMKKAAQACTDEKMLKQISLD